MAELSVNGGAAQAVGFTGCNQQQRPCGYQSVNRGDWRWEPRTACEVVRNSCLDARGDGSELLLGDAVVECSLDGGPGGTDKCWWVFRVAEEVFDELLCVVAGSSSGLKDERDQVHAGMWVRCWLNGSQLVVPA